MWVVLMLLTTDEVNRLSSYLFLLLPALLLLGHPLKLPPLASTVALNS
jgi:hypothetical protein